MGAAHCDFWHKQIRVRIRDVMNIGTTDIHQKVHRKTIEVRAKEDGFHKSYIASCLRIGCSSRVKQTPYLECLHCREVL